MCMYTHCYVHVSRTLLIHIKYGYVRGRRLTHVRLHLKGSGKSITIYAEHPDTGAKQPYTILTSRLLGRQP